MRWRGSAAPIRPARELPLVGLDSPVGVLGDEVGVDRGGSRDHLGPDIGDVTRHPDPGHLDGAQLWTWDLSRRPPGAKMHAKLAVADERLLFVSSANLTTSGIDANIEAGVLIRGGSAARRATEYLRALRRDRVLVRL